MAGAAALPLIHIVHDHFRSALLHGEQLRVADVAGDGPMAFVNELHRLGPLNGVGQGGRSLLCPGITTIRMTPVTVAIEGRSFFPVTGKAYLGGAVIGKSDPGCAFLEREKTDMAAPAFGMRQMGAVLEKHGLLLLAESDNRFRCRHLGMTTAAIIPGKGFAAVMTGKTVLGCAVIGHGHLVGALLDLEKARMAGTAFDISGVDFMVVADDPLPLAKRLGGLVDGHILLRPHALYPDMAAGALGIGGESGLAIVAGATILSFIQGSHGKILFFLGLQGLHFEQTAVTLITGQFLLEMGLMGEEDGMDGLGVQDAAAVDDIMAVNPGRDRHIPKNHDNQNHQTLLHFVSPIIPWYKKHSAWRRFLPE